MKSIQSLAGVALALGVIAGCGPQKPELHIYTWSDYIAPEVIKGFEEKNGCKIVIDTFDSNETMYAKLKAGATGYDIIMPSSYQIGTMVSEGMVQKLDHAKIPNVRKNFAKEFAGQIVDSEFTYNVPYAVTYTGFAYLKEKLPKDADANTWSILANPALKGQISLLDDQREVIGAGLMSLGFSVNSTNPDEINKAVEQVLKWKENIRKFDAESYKTEVASGAILLGHGYSTDVIQLIVGDEEEGVKPREDIGFALPKEGFSISFDEMVIAKDAKQIDLAYAFINYIYEPEVAKENMEYICGPNPVGPAIALLDEDYRKRIIPDDEVMKRGQVLRGFDNKPEVLELYNKAWDRIKASK
ncbi:MAG: spermidine/putrescine ABC transporter substrate-binding protein [Kiritimatiellae bacterium]|nr:spermidine/putrescine ABC transporter substrate-binding protein [Kiritimatiellia bacterium]